MLNYQRVPQLASQIIKKKKKKKNNPKTSQRYILPLKSLKYQLVMTNSSPWKITMFKNGVYHLFRLGPSPWLCWITRGYVISIYNIIQYSQPFHTVHHIEQGLPQLASQIILKKCVKIKNMLYIFPLKSMNSISFSPSHTGWGLVE